MLKRDVLEAVGWWVLVITTVPWIIIGIIECLVWVSKFLLVP